MSRCAADSLAAMPPPTHLSHPESFKSGTRLLMLKSRHKDGYIGRERAILRQSNSMDSFDALLDELRVLMRPNERIYASASPRNLMRAGRLFAERFMASSYDPPEVRENFHRRLPFNWYSCLRQHEAADKSDKWWMFDCDDDRTHDLVMRFTADMDRYVYGTKSGHHVLVRPYNRQTTPSEIGQFPDANPLILWSHR